jgi:hypothetical protein
MEAQPKPKQSKQQQWIMLGSDGSFDPLFFPVLPLIIVLVRVRYYSVRKK